MKKSVDLRTRVGTLIKTIEQVPPKHLTPAMLKLLTDLRTAAETYDNEER